MAVHELFSYLCVADAQAAVEFYCKVFEASEKFRLVEPGGRIGHVELDLGGTTLMLCEEFPEVDIRRPQPQHGHSHTLHLHVDDADDTVARAVAAGARLTMAPRDHFYGERSGTVIDPFGHRWNIGHSIEALAPEEMQRRYDLDPDCAGGETASD
ncbi:MULTISPECIES: VOC family protein [Lysobacter]|uniref:VOC family protein n=1 Tax=Lysobacter gummosus TaxID=262324 RepID=A0ABY3XFS8_9GAMM|nr:MULTISPECIES: VOC family protein [Lysobacter]ALN89888.1 glyoxalase/Bleomycin resistance /Dioxygenase superfamily protein [Lysobacter gummosus]UJB18237.1 VOC family protein [Lysobacter capsici]UJQ28040.1 VOC family protein [Lysobacter gummosus]UNP30482.1 VOC family protein [Lysobacter gummosus]